ncbi:hypothetical protein K7432_002225 [Basidiobolus ranarum]|uniref:Uncharacterized protein n=1 Tax=Basidiobolus ranarum TaxID=34480 RepID=A0ABR2X1U7_9FUNG
MSTLFNLIGPESISMLRLTLTPTAMEPQPENLVDHHRRWNADDRIFSTPVKARYNIDTSIGVENIPFNRIFDGVCKTSLDVFACDDSDFSGYITATIGGRNSRI